MPPDVLAICNTVQWAVIAVKSILISYHEIRRDLGTTQIVLRCSIILCKISQI